METYDQGHYVNKAESGDDMNMKMREASDSENNESGSEEDDGRDDPYWKEYAGGPGPRRSSNFVSSLND